LRASRIIGVDVWSLRGERRKEGADFRDIKGALGRHGAIHGGVNGLVPAGMGTPAPSDRLVVRQRAVGSREQETPEDNDARPIAADQVGGVGSSVVVNPTAVGRGPHVMIIRKKLSAEIECCTRVILPLCLKPRVSRVLDPKTGGEVGRPTFGIL